MSLMKQLILEKTKHLDEDKFTIDGDMNDRIKIEATPVNKATVKKMAEEGKGLRILVGADRVKDLLVIWVGDSDSNVGAMHDTVADQLGLDLYDERHVPLEMSPTGKLRLTVTAQDKFDDPREVYDVLDRNSEYKKVFGSLKIDMSTLGIDGRI